MENKKLQNFPSAIAWFYITNEQNIQYYICYFTLLNAELLPVAGNTPAQQKKLQKKCKRETDLRQFFN